MGILATATRQQQSRQGITATPVLDVHHDNGTQFVCGGQVLPREFAGRSSLWVSIAIPADGLVGPCTFVNLFQSDGSVYGINAIDAIVVRTSDQVTSDP